MKSIIAPINFEHKTNFSNERHEQNSSFPNTCLLRSLLGIPITQAPIQSQPKGGIQPRVLAEKDLNTVPNKSPITIKAKSIINDMSPFSIDQNRIQKEIDELAKELDAVKNKNMKLRLGFKSIIREDSMKTEQKQENIVEKPKLNEQKMNIFTKKPILENNFIDNKAQNNMTANTKQEKKIVIYENHAPKITNNLEQQKSCMVPSSGNYLQKLMKEHAPQKINNSQFTQPFSNSIILPAPIKNELVKKSVCLTIGISQNTKIAENFKKSCPEICEKYESSHQKSPKIKEKPIRTKEEILKLRHEMMKPKTNGKTTEIRAEKSCFVVNMKSNENTVKLPPKKLLERLAAGTKIAVIL